MLIDIIPLPKRPHKERYTSSRVYQSHLNGCGRWLGRKLTWDTDQSVFKYKFIEVDNYSVGERIVLSRQPLLEGNRLRHCIEPTHIYPLSLKRYDLSNKELTFVRFSENIKSALQWLWGNHQLVTTNRLLLDTIAKYLHKYPIYPLDMYHLDKCRSRSAIDGVTLGNDQYDAHVATDIEGAAIAHVNAIQQHQYNSVSLEDKIDNDRIEQLSLIKPNDTISKMMLGGSGELLFHDLHPFMDRTVKTGLYRNWNDPTPVFEVTSEVLFGAGESNVKQLHRVINYLNELPYTDISMRYEIDLNGSDSVEITNTACLYLQTIEDHSTYLEEIRMTFGRWSEGFVDMGVHAIEIEKTSLEELFITLELDGMSCQIYFDLVLYGMANYSLVDNVL